MIKKLRRRLTVIFTAMTGAILIAVLGISLWYSIQQAKEASISNFTYTSYITLTEITNESDSTAMNMLETLEQEKSYTISITIDGEPASVCEDVDQTQRNKIIQAATKAVEASTIEEDNYPDTYYDHEVFTVEQNITVHAEDQIDEGAYYTAIGFIENVIDYPIFELDGTSYRANAFSENLNERQYDILFVEDLSEMNQSILLLWLGYGSLMLIGIFLLTLVNWFLSKLIVKPTAEGIKQQTEFVAAASHELRSPLAVLKASLSASEIADTPEDAQKYRSCAMAESERLGRLVDDLLLLAGSDSHKWTLNAYDFDVDTLLIDLHEQYTPISRERNHEFLLELPEETLGSINGDRDRIRQMLGILIDNALEYSPPDTTVTLSALKKKGKLYLEVLDEGPGLSEEDKKRIFQRFYRADKSRSDKTHFGLGLSIASELAELHGGALSVKDNPAGGSLFTLRLND